MKAAPTPPPTVTLHAIERFVERVLDLGTPPDIEGLTAVQRAEAYCAHAGLTAEQISEMILQPDVRGALAAGLTQVRNSLFRAILDPGKGVVITVFVVGPPTKPLRTSPFSRQENRKRQRENNRRYASRPSVRRVGRAER